MHTRPRYYLHWIVAAFVALSGCGGSTEPHNSPGAPPGNSDTTGTPVVTSPPDTVFTLAVVAHPTTITVGTTDSITVKLTDSAGAPVANRTVTFATPQASASVSQHTVLTDAHGLATTRLTVGTIVAFYDLIASAPHVSQQLDVSVTAIPGAPVSLVLNSKFLFIDDAGSSFGMYAFDAYDNLVDLKYNALLACTPRTPGIISVDPSTSMLHKLATGQTMLVCSASSEKADSMLVVALPSGSLWLGVLPDSFTVSPNATVRAAITLDEEGISKSVGSVTFTITWDPAQLRYISYTLAHSDPAVVNTTDVAHGHITVSYASTTGMTYGEVIAVQFEAASTVGETGAISVAVSQCAEAHTFADMLPHTLGSSYPLAIK